MNRDEVVEELQKMADFFNEVPHDKICGVKFSANIYIHDADKNQSCWLADWLRTSRGVPCESNRANGFYWLQSSPPNKVDVSVFIKPEVSDENDE